MAADVEFGEKVINLSSAFPDVTGLGNHKCFTCFSVVVGTAMSGLWVVFLSSKLTLVCG